LSKLFDFLLHLFKGYGFGNVPDHHRRWYGFIKFLQKEIYFVNKFAIAGEVFICFVGMFVVFEPEFDVGVAFQNTFLTATGE
jgi:hypothetical protein